VVPNRHKMTENEKRTYIDAELCLMSKPAKIPLRGAKTMFDEFQALHVMQAELAHFVVRVPRKNGKNDRS
jgi:tyrosinase